MSQVTLRPSIGLPIQLEYNPNPLPWSTRPNEIWPLLTSLNLISGCSFHLLIKLKLYKSFCCSLNRASSFLPQRLCICCFLCLEYCSSTSSHGCFLLIIQVSAQMLHPQRPSLTVLSIVAPFSLAPPYSLSHYPVYFNFIAWSTV